MIWIGYTTLYREGGASLARAAHTLAAARRSAAPTEVVRCEAVESKREFVDAMADIGNRGQALSELHFVGHAGIYGPMFGTRHLPEQFSPHEWRSLRIPFAEDAEAYFHACRTARWFAPFFSRTFGVPASGYYYYTSFSASPDRFVWPGPRLPAAAPLYVVGCPGRKSDGWVGSLRKYLGLAPVEALRRFLPPESSQDSGYDPVAGLYDAAFADIRVRGDELAWIDAHWPKGRAVSALDVGCGNGSLLAYLSPRLRSGVGVDASAGMLERARARCAGLPNLSFSQVDGPTLPFADRSFDVVVSLLSFRYLDWDPLMNELRRVLAPGGKLLIIDMVTAPLRLPELPGAVVTQLRHRWQTWRNPRFAGALGRLVRDPSWETMLQYNPIRAEHELRWYLESRYPGRPIEVLNVSRSNRVLAFDSGPLFPGWVAPQSYP